MAVYSALSKIARITTPAGSTYALVDQDLREIVCSEWVASASYSVGDYVLYQDNFYKCKTANSDASWTSAKWELSTVSGELKAIRQEIAGGIHYRGRTTTSLYDGATTSPILVNGNSYTPEAGDLVIETPPAYATGVAYVAGEYITYSSHIYQVEEAITAANNTQFSDVVTNLANSEPEFIFDGSNWAEFGSLRPLDLGNLAFKDTATGSYVKPTGSGSVTIKNYSPSTKKLSTTTITGTDGTVNASNITNIASGTFATAGEQVTVAQADADTTLVGNADVDTAVAVGTSLTGTTTFNTDAIKAASLTGTTTFNTDAIKEASLTGTTTFATSGVTTSVDGDCLTFSAAGTASVGISTTAASTASVGISTTAASTGTVGLGTSNITPAKAVSVSSASVRGVSGTTTITPVGGTASAVTGVTYSAVTPAAVAASATTVATGSLETGTDLVTGITAGTESATVTVGTTTDTVTVA